MPDFNLNKECKRKLKGFKAELQSAAEEEDTLSINECLESILILLNNEVKLVKLYLKDMLTNELFLLQDSLGFTALHHSAKEGNAEVAELILSLCPKSNNVEAEGGDEMSEALPIHYASAAGHLETVKVISKYCDKDDINANHSLEVNAIQEALLHGNSDVVKYLLNHPEIDLNIQYEKEGQTSDFYFAVHIPYGANLLHMAVMMDDMESAGAILDKNVIDVDDTTAIPDDYQIDDEDVLETDNAQWTALHLAVKQGSLSMVKLLMSQGASIEIKDIFGLSPACYAIIYDKPKILKYLLKQKPSVDVKDVKGDSIFLGAVSEDRIEIIGILLKAREAKLIHLDINQYDSKKRTALHIACEYGLTKIVELLAAQPGIDFNAEDDNGETPLGLAIEAEHAAIVHILKKKRVCNVNHKVSQSGNKRLAGYFREQLHKESSYNELWPEIISSIANEIANDMDGEMSDSPAEGQSILDKTVDSSPKIAQAIFSKGNLALPDAEQEIEIKNKKIKNLYEGLKKRKSYEGKYTTPGSSSDDSDDDKPNPYTLEGSEEEQDIEVETKPDPKRIFIALFRGETFRSAQCSKNDRREARQAIQTNELTGVHSLASHALSNVPVNKVTIHNEGPLIKASQAVAATYLTQFSRKLPQEIITEFSKKHKGIRPEVQENLMLHQYTNKYRRFQEEQKAAASKDYSALKKPYNKKEIEQRFQGIPYAENGLISTSERARSACGFGSGVSVDYAPIQTMPRIRKTTGKVKRPYLGTIIISLHSLQELKNIPHVLSQVAEKKIGLGLIYRNARENIVPGYISRENIVHKYKLRIPNLEEYNPKYQVKYGLSEQQFLKFKADMQQSDEGSIERKCAEKNLINHILDFQAPHFEKIAKEAALKKGGVLQYRAINGGYTSVLPSLKNIANAFICGNTPVGVEVESNKENAEHDIKRIKRKNKI